MYLKDVSKKKETPKKNGPPSFQAAFESLVASRSGALALRPGSVVEEMPPKKQKPKKRKPAEGTAVANPQVKQEGVPGKHERNLELSQNSSDLSIDNSDSYSSTSVKMEKSLQGSTEIDTVKQLIPKKRSRKENPKNSSYSFLPLTQTNMTSKQVSQSDFNRLNFLQPTIQWIKQQQMLQNSTKGKHYAESPFNQISGVSFGDLLSSTANQPSRDSHYVKQEIRVSSDSDAQRSASVSKSITVVSPTSLQGTADYIKTVRVKATPSATVTSEAKHEGTQALDLSFSSSTSSESVNCDKKTLLENSAVSETSDYRNLDPKPPDIMNAPPMKLTGSQQSLFSSMSEAFKVANSMLACKPEPSHTASNSPRSLLSPGRQRVGASPGVAEAVSHGGGTLGSPPLQNIASASTTCIGSSSLFTNLPISSHSSQRPPQAHMIRPSNPNPRLQQFNPSVPSTTQSNLLLQALGSQQNLTSQQQQTFLVNIPVMHSGTTTGSSSTCITPTSITTNASQVKQNIVLTNGVLLNNVKSSASPGTAVSSKPTVSQLLKATRGLTNSESKSHSPKMVNSSSTTKYVPMKSPSGTISLVPVVSQAGGNAILLQNQSAANVIQIASTTSGLTGNIIVQPNTVQKVNNRLVQQTVTTPLRIAVSPQAGPNSSLCIISQTMPVGARSQQTTFAMAGKPQANVVASAPVIGQKTATVPQFGGRPQFPGTTQFLLQGVTQIHPSPTAFQVDPKTPLFQTIVTSTNVTATQSCTQAGTVLTQPVTTVNLNSTHVTETANLGQIKKMNGVPASNGFSSDVDQTYGAIVSPNKVLQLVPQPIVPISQVSTVTSLTTTTSSISKHRLATDISQENIPMQVSRRDSDSGDINLESKVKAGLLSPSSNQSLYRMSSPGSDDKTLVQVSSYSAFSGNHPNKKSPNKPDNSSNVGEMSSNKVSY